MAKDKLPEIRICNVATDLHTALNNIADNSGVTVQQLLKPKLREIVDGYPAHMKSKRED